MAVGKLERGETSRPNNWRLYALEFGIDEAEADSLIALDAVDAGKESKVGKSTSAEPEKMAHSVRRSMIPKGKIPIVGSASAGDSDRLVMLTEVVELVDPPQELNGVTDGYAVFVHGTSMQPRYFPGERVYVHPHKPVKKGDFCVIQIGADKTNPDAGFIKQFISRDEKHVKVSQLNPFKIITFRAEEVIAVDRIVGSGSN